MPSFAASLSAEQIATVVSFERVRFGGGDPATVLADCGLVAAPRGRNNCHDRRRGRPRRNIRNDGRDSRHNGSLTSPLKRA